MLDDGPVQSSCCPDYTEPVRLELTPLPGRSKLDLATQDAGSWKADCRGGACHGARFRVKNVGRAERPRFRFILRGGRAVTGCARAPEGIARGCVGAASAGRCRGEGR